MFTATACDKTNRSFSLLGDANSFQQVPTVVERKVDILWVIDNSGSMETSQTNLTSNFQSFIQRFQDLKYDFRMAVISSDAYRADYSSNDAFKDIMRRWRRGKPAGSNPNYFYSPDSGVHVMNPQTPDLASVFVTNATQGTGGSGDERVFQSLKATLDPNFALNNDFPRTDAFLAVIIVSDEDDFSADTGASFYYVAGDYADEVNADPWDLTSGSLYNLYNDPRLVPVSTYKDFLDSRFGAGNHSVSAITILDNDCKALLNQSSFGRRLGRRYAQLVDATGGTKSSLCDNFGQSLQLISNKILENSSSFKLDREPNPASIKVLVDGALINQDAVNGWTYDATTLTITFHGSAVPQQGASIQVSFDPIAPKN